MFLETIKWFALLVILCQSLPETAQGRAQWHPLRSDTAYVGEERHCLCRRGASLPIWIRFFARRLTNVFNERSGKCRTGGKWRISLHFVRFARERIQWTVREMQKCWKIKDFVAFCEICSRTYSMNGSGNAELVENGWFRCILWDLLANIFNERFGKCRTGGKSSSRLVRFSAEPLIWFINSIY